MCPPYPRFSAEDVDRCDALLYKSSAVVLAFTALAQRLSIPKGGTLMHSPVAFLETPVPVSPPVEGRQASSRLRGLPFLHPERDPERI